MATKTKPTFTPTEKRILRLLYQTKAPLTIYEIAKQLGISYPTAKKYTEKLAKEGAIDEENG